MKNIQHWPPGLPLHLELPQTSLFYNLDVSATRYPDRDAIVYYGNAIKYAELKRQVDVVAGFLQRKFQVVKGDGYILRYTCKIVRSLLLLITLFCEPVQSSCQ